MRFFSSTLLALVAAVTLPGLSMAQDTTPAPTPAPAPAPANPAPANPAPEHPAPGAREQAFIARFDANGDGKVTMDEVNAWAQHIIDTGDKDKDGKLSVAEYRDVMAETQFKELDKDNNGQISLEEFTASRGGGRGGMGGMMARDENGDGFLTVDELTAMTKRMFETADADHDGAITADELAAARGAGRGGRGQGGGGQGRQDGQGPQGRPDGQPRPDGQGQGQGQGGGRQGGRGRTSPEDAFKQIDTDGNGSLSLDEFKAHMAQLATRAGGRGGRGQGGQGGNSSRVF